MLLGKKIILVVAASLLLLYVATLTAGRGAVENNARALLLKEIVEIQPRLASAPPELLREFQLELFVNRAIAPGVIYAGYGVLNSESHARRVFLWLGACTLLLRADSPGAIFGVKFVSTCD